VRIIYLDLDCMRPDHFGGLGYHRDTTPNLDAIIREGMAFTRYYCSDAPCMPSRAALFSGRFGVHNGVTTHWGLGSEFRYTNDPPMFMRHLHAHGRRTVSFSSFADRHEAWWFAAGWRELHTFTLKRGGENADEVNAAALPWIEQNAEADDYFLHLHYWDPHRNYTMPMEWMDHFRDEPPPAWPDAEAIAEQQSCSGPFTAPELFPWRGQGSPVPSMPEAIRNVDDWKRFVDGYDAAIRYMDHHIGQVLSALADKGVLDEAAIIISADHAEAMGEFGVYGDHVCACEAVQNIPLIVRWPGVTAAGARCDDLLYNVDLPPTVCELLGVPVPEGWDGQSFAPALRGEQGRSRDHVVWTHGLYCCQRCVRDDGWLLTRTYHPGLYPFPPLQLHDMAGDPHQTRNVADEHPEVVARLDHRLMEWHAANLGRPGTDTDPLQEVVRTGPWKYVQLEPWLERLEAKGRGDAAREIRERQ
jgi:choline-sulfatase